MLEFDPRQEVFYTRFIFNAHRTLSLDLRQRCAGPSNSVVGLPGCRVAKQSRISATAGYVQCLYYASCSPVEGGLEPTRSGLRNSTFQRFKPHALGNIPVGCPVTISLPAI